MIISLYFSLFFLWRKSPLFFLPSFLPQCSCVTATSMTDSWISEFSSLLTFYSKLCLSLAIKREIKDLTPAFLFLTWVNSYPYPDRYIRHVTHMEGTHWAEDVKWHVGDLSSVLVSISLWQAWCYHVGITNGLHLHQVNMETQVSQ